MNVDLEKRTQKVGIILEKRGLRQAPVMQVVVAIDISGSMDDEFADGSVQNAVDQLLGVAMKFDDNGEMECWGFDTGTRRAPTITEADYGNYIGSRNRLGKFGMWPRGGTAYAPVLQSIITEMCGPATAPAKPSFFGFGAKKEAAAPAGMPVMVLFITDGEPNDGPAADRVIREATNKNIYFQMIGVGNDCRFNTLRSLADKYDNCGFVQMTNIRMSDDQLYEQLITDELVTFCKKQVTQTA